MTVVDDHLKVLGWERQLPLGGGCTERYQILDQISENETKSFIVLRVPSVVGFFTKLSLNKIIQGAFQSLNEGIKNEAEHVRPDIS